MKPMFLPGVEENPKPGAHGDLISAMPRGGLEYPQIWRRFAFLSWATERLPRFKPEILRRPDASGAMALSGEARRQGGKRTPSQGYVPAGLGRSAEGG